eukprot:TRINITY_DN8683_c0_g1_i2.p2 TRINITY_DN8683_c0_g1~~TRINITY_DN8683_c0_g1_i2.p2  ORF type:complete len:334 (-),score=28.79 TRINITY_DN8683_c0_g1_i2:75-1076(-)
MGLKLGYDVECLSVRRIEGVQVVCGGLCDYFGAYWTGGLVFVKTLGKRLEEVGNHTIKRLRTGVGAVRWLPNKDQATGTHILVSGGDDGDIDFWGVQLVQNLKSEDEVGANHLSNSQGHSHYVTDIVVVQDEQLISCGYDGCIKLWDVSKTQDCIASTLLPNVPALAACVDDSMCFIAGEEKCLRGWDIRACRWQSKILMNYPVNCMDIHSNHLLAADYMGQVHLVDIRNLKPIHSQQLHADGYLSRCLKIHSRGRSFVSCGEDGRVLVIDQFITEDEQFSCKDFEEFVDVPVWPQKCVCWGQLEDGGCSSVIYKGGSDQMISSHEVVLYNQS